MLIFAWIKLLQLIISSYRAFLSNITAHTRPGSLFTVPEQQLGAS